MLLFLEGFSSSPAALPSPVSLRLSSLAFKLHCQPCSPRRKRMMMGAIAASPNGSLLGLDEQKPTVGRRKVIEHIALFQMKKEFDEIQEKDMLDHLYTLQYQLRGIVSLSLGTITSQNSDGYTHALFSRFPSKETLKIYYESPIRWNIANQYIIPYYNGMLCVDYEADVEDDINPIFRRGEDFEEGVESMILLQVRIDVDPKRVEEGLLALSCLFAEELGPFVIQHTSEEAMNICIQHGSYREIMERMLEPITDKIVSLDYPIVPVGTSAM